MILSIEFKNYSSINVRAETLASTVIEKSGSRPIRMDDTKNSPYGGKRIIQVLEGDVEGVTSYLREAFVNGWEDLGVMRHSKFDPELHVVTIDMKALKKVQEPELRAA